MNAAFGIIQHPWNFAANSGAQLERAAGEIPLTHVTVPVVTGPISQVRLGADGEHPWFSTPGGFHYLPDGDVLGACGLRPPKARWQGQADLVGRIAEAADQRALKLVLRVDLRAVTQLVEQHGHLAQRNAWGQEVLTAGACALNPELRELLRLTLTDLRRYEPSALEILSWRPDHVAGPRGNGPLEWHPLARRLLNLCFCPACRQVAQRADVDPEQAARATRVSFEHRLTQTPRDRATTDDLDPLIAAYAAARETDCQAWLRRLAEADDERVYYSTHALSDLPVPADLPPLRRALILPTRGADIEAALERALSEKPAALSLAVWRPVFTEAATLVRTVTAAVQHEVETLDFDGLEQTPDEGITWLRQAVRYASRT